jgi:SWI/SNF-related matrix-associated actin-dependent regulator 1 of chromatin subfamily A
MTRVTVDPTGPGFFFDFDYTPERVVAVKTVPGARWDKQLRTWRIPATALALRSLRRLMKDPPSCFDLSATERAGQILERGARLRSLSEAHDCPEYIGPASAELWPFQRAGVQYGIETSRFFLGDDLGLGKTVEALVCLAAWEDAFPALVVCKRSAVPHWARLAAKWLPGRSIVLGIQPGRDVQIVTWGELSRMGEPDKDMPDDAEQTLLALEDELGFQSVLLDESHHAKNAAANRTKAALRLAAVARYRICITGNIIVNRPAELIAQLRILGRLDSDFGSAWTFMHRYCDAQPAEYYRGGERKTALDYSGSSRLEELAEALRSTCYVRREKKGPNGVLQQLPDLTTEVVPIELSPADRTEYMRAENNFLGWLRQQDPDAADRAEKAEELVKINALRHRLAQMKLDGIVEWANDFLEDNPESKLVLFAYHLDIVAELAMRIPGSVTLVGAHSMKERETARENFQREGGPRSLVAQITTGGESIELYAASTVGIVEPMWTPKDHDQAIARLWRAGQKNAVVAHYFLAKGGTIDERMYELVEEKRRTVDVVTSIFKDLVSQFRKELND